jgi:hypothetical protein
METRMGCELRGRCSLGTMALAFGTMCQGAPAGSDAVNGSTPSHGVAAAGQPQLDLPAKRALRRLPAVGCEQSPNSACGNCPVGCVKVGCPAAAQGFS